MRTDGVWGFYPIVDRAERVEWLLSLGVKTVQLRIKDLKGSALRDEIDRALQAAPGVQLYINDHWREALELGATHLHLGQEDLDGADLQAISHLAIGVSTHSPEELQRGLSIDPDYVALGPVWETTLKKMPWAPQGVERLTQWKRQIDKPLVAIGGISLERAPAALQAGADSIAIVSDIQRPTRAASEARVRAWLDLFAAGR